MKYTEQGNFKLQEFPSIGEFTKYLKDTPANRYFQGYNERSKDSNHRFRGTYTLNEAHNLLDRGWAPEAEVLSKKVPVQTVQRDLKSSTPAYGVVGYQASVPRYLQGVPTNMITRSPDVKKQKIIVINKSMNYNAIWKKEDIEREGIKALQIIQALEGKGYRVKLNMVWAAGEVLTSKNAEILAVSITIKKPEDRLNLLKMAFPLVHPSMLRRILFRWLEVHPNMTSSQFTWGYGYPRDDAYKTFIPKGEYLLPQKIGDINEYIESLGL